MDAFYGWGQVWGVGVLATDIKGIGVERGIEGGGFWWARKVRGASWALWGGARAMCVFVFYLGGPGP